MTDKPICSWCTSCRKKRKSEGLSGIVRRLRATSQLRKSRPECLVYNAFMSFRAPQGNPNAAKRDRTPPPEDTYEEATFLKGLGEKQKAVSVKLMDGQVFHGWIEYYDRNMVRLTREDAPNLFIFKHEIMYIAEEGGRRK